MNRTVAMAAALSLTLATAAFSDELPMVIPLDGAVKSAMSSPGQTVIKAGTEIRVAPKDTLSSARLTAGQQVEFTVVRDVSDVTGKTLIPAGSPARGHVIRSSRAGSFGKPGRFAIVIESVQSPSGRLVPVISPGAQALFRADGRNARAGAISSGLIVGLAAGAIAALAVVGSSFGSGDRSISTNAPVVAFIGAGGLAAVIWRGGEAAVPAGREFKVVVAVDTELCPN